VVKDPESRQQRTRDYNEVKRLKHCFNPEVSSVIESIDSRREIFFDNTNIVFKTQKNQ
jgi:hypothetical protein